jgi:hypothetical protein
MARFCERVFSKRAADEMRCSRYSVEGADAVI